MKTLAMALCAAALSGCFVETDDDRGYIRDNSLRGGELVIDWTINGDKNPSECRQSDAESVVITIYSRGGGVVGDYDQDCEAFATSIPLPPGDYAADAVILDYDGYERTTAVEIDPFSIYSGDSVVVDIDFPARSFL